MFEEIKIVIPSHKRVDLVSTLKLLPQATLCLAESQVAEYKERYPDTEIVSHSDSIVGLPLKRQWIAEKFNNVFMMDDDILRFVRRYHEGEVGNSLVDNKTCYALIQSLYFTAKEMGVHLFSFSNDGDIRNYDALHPFSYTKLIHGSAFGLINFDKSKLFYDNRQTAVGDSWITCLNAHHNRFSFIDNRFSFVAGKTFKVRGGQSEFRTMETEMKDYVFLKKCFGDVIGRKKPTKRTSLVHKYQRTLNIPL